MRIQRRESIWASVVFLAIATLVACDSNDPRTTQPPPPPPMGPVIVESFSGQIAQFETACHDFTMNVNGNIEMEITDLQPLSSLTVGLALGQPDPSVATGCAVFVRDDSVRLFEVLASNGLLAGPYCACIGDVGNIFPNEIVDYTLEIRHP